MSSFGMGFREKFAESLGSGLAYGLVTLCGALFLIFVAATPIVEFVDSNDECMGEKGTCRVTADCNTDSVAVGGTCAIDPKGVPQINPILDTAGVYFARQGDAEPRRYECHWHGGIDQSTFKPSVRVACIKKRTLLGLVKLSD